MIVWVLSVIGCAERRTREENSKDNGRSILRKPKVGKREKEKGNGGRRAAAVVSGEEGEGETALAVLALQRVRSTK